MSLVTNLTNGFQRTGNLIKETRTWLGVISGLATTDKSSVVAAVNEIHAEIDGLGTAADLNVPATGNAAAGEVVKGDDTRLADARTASETTVTQPEAEAGIATDRRIWTAQRVAQAIAAIGATLFAAVGHTHTPSQVGLGNVNNTSDAAKPVSTAQQTALDAKADNAVVYTRTQLDGFLGDKADLVGGLVPTNQLPAIAKNETFTAAGEAAMVALTAEVGDVAIRTDFTPSQRWILVGDSTVADDWKPLGEAGGAVKSVNTQTGDVVLGAADVGAYTTAQIGDVTTDFVAVVNAAIA